MPSHPTSALHKESGKIKHYPQSHYIIRHYPSKHRVFCPLCDGNNRWSTQKCVGTLEWPGAQGPGTMQKKGTYKYYQHGRAEGSQSWIYLAVVALKSHVHAPIV
ncbi:hypothetical protein BU17DRAFT_65909 [Hysterangium stoloniferum]|nr:hypothetical protein BU17DRAFT_65909 [Hysterangium stoloniferum]